MNHLGSSSAANVDDAAARATVDASTAIVSSLSSGNAQPNDQQQQIDNDAPATAITTGPRKVDVSHFPHYGLKRGMACTFCRKRKLRCSGDRPSCTNCVKYTKVCEYGPPVKEPKKHPQAGSSSLGAGRQFELGGPQHEQQMHHQQLPPPPPAQHGSMAHTIPFDALSGNLSTLYTANPVPSSSTQIPYDMFQDPSFVESSFIDTNNISPDGIAYASSNPFDFVQPSPFVGAPIAQPVIGMPPYVAPTTTSFSVFPDPPLPQPQPQHHQQQQQQQQHQQWVPAPQTLPPQSFDGDVSTTSLPDMYNAYNGSYPNSGGTFSDSLNGSRNGNNSNPSASLTGLPSDPTTPEDPITVTGNNNNNGGVLGGVSNDSGSNTPSSAASRAQPAGAHPSSMYRQAAALHYVSEAEIVEGITERLGEFLFSPNASSVKEEEAPKRRKKSSAPAPPRRIPSPGSIARMRTEYDGLTDASRTLLLSCFLAHTSLFFEMSVPRFQYRMTFSDRRRPSLALLNAMYLWATRISNSPQMISMEKHFFDQACRYLDASTSTVDRLIDAVRAAMLLAAYSHSSGRHHEGWCLAGLAVRLVLSCGLHRIKSCVHKPEPPNNPFLRNRFFLLPPAEDSVELGERIHAFWSVFAIDRCSALATGYPAGMRDEEITTPFARPLSDIASGSVSERDNATIRDMYTRLIPSAERDSSYTRWVKCVAILERSAKLCFADPAPDSPYAMAWSNYTLAVRHNPNTAQPPAALHQPQYCNPIDYQECRLAVEGLLASMGEEGVFPVVRKQRAVEEGRREPVISNHVLMLHHLVAGINMTLHDINSLDIENGEALKAARQSVLMFRAMPPIPFTDVDAFVVLVWSMIAKVLVKEIRRLTKLGEQAAALEVASEADTFIEEMSRIGMTMHLAGTQATALAELKRAALAANDVDGAELSMPHLETFLFHLPAPATASSAFAQ